MTNSVIDRRRMNENLEEKKNTKLSHRLNRHLSMSCALLTKPSCLVLNRNSSGFGCRGTAPAELIENDFSGVKTLTTFGYNAAHKMADSKRLFSPWMFNYII